MRWMRWKVIKFKSLCVKTGRTTNVFSLRLGHSAALTTHRVVIHYRTAASLPYKKMGSPQKRASDFVGRGRVAKRSEPFEPAEKASEV